MIIYVNSFEEAQKYPVMYNTSEVFFDNHQDRFYCKAVDSSGRFVMSTYDFHQVENEKPLTSADFVPKEQFDALAAKLDNLLMLLTAPQPSAGPADPTQPNPPRTKGANHDGK